MNSKHHKKKQQKYSLLGGIFILILIALVWWFWPSQVDEPAGQFYAIERPKEPVDPKLRSICQVDYNRKHKISKDLITKDTVWIRVEALIDNTGESSAFEGWKQQRELLTRMGVNSLLGYDKRLVQTNFQIYSAEDYKDSFPDPNLTLELYLMDFAITRGSKEKFKKTYCATLENGTNLSTDVVWTNKYKKVHMTGLFRLMNDQCQLITSRQETVEAVEEEIWQFYHGPKHILPEAELVLHNRLPYQLVKLKDDEYVVFSGLKKLYTQLLGRFSAVISPLAKRRAKLKLPDYSGLIEETSNP